MTGHHITLFQLNDLHGYLEPHSELIWHDGEPRFPMMGGLSRIATLFDQARTGDGNAFFFDNGDTFHGTYVAVNSKGKALLPILNRLAFDAMTAHWDFAWGPKHLQHLVSHLSYPMLACNCFNKDSEQLTFPATLLIERGGVKLGVVGIAATIVDKSMPPQFSEGLHLTLGIDELPGHIRDLRRRGADILVVLSHLGFPQDVKLAAAVHGIDVLLSGHTHNRLAEPVCINGAIIIQSGCHGSFIGRLDLELMQGEVSLLGHRLIPIDETIPSNSEVDALVEAAMAPDTAALSRVVGHTTTPLHRATTLDAPMDDLLLDAVAEAAGMELAFSNGWRYGAPVPPGPIRMSDLWNVIPTNPPISVVELTGAEIRSMLEENLERTFSADPFDQMGGFVKRCRGLHLYGKVENPAGHRIESLFVEGKPIILDKIYRAAFVTMQAVPKKYGRNRQDLEVHAIAALERYLARTPSIAIVGRHNVVLA